MGVDARGYLLGESQVAIKLELPSTFMVFKSLYIAPWPGCTSDTVVCTPKKSVTKLTRANKKNVNAVAKHEDKKGTSCIAATQVATERTNWQKFL